MTSRMRLNLLNAVAAAAAVAASLGIGIAFEAAAPAAHVPSAATGLVDLPASACTHGEAPCRGLFDSSGTPVAVRHFTRIASGNVVADGLLLALAEPNRIAAYSPYAHELSENHRFIGPAHLSSLEDVEGLLGLRPDLFIISSMSDRNHVRRMRDAGIAVFDLGPMEGLTNLPANITTVSLLLGFPERGEQLYQRVQRRLATLARGGKRSWRALYVGIHGDKMYGGTLGSSLHDVIEAAGLIDAAADKFRGWPGYTHEDLLGIDPDVILTQTGMAEKLCRHPGLDQLLACKTPNRVIELPSALLTDPGLTVLDAAEAVASIVAQWGAPLAAPVP
jgi:iron complex transport system substrate-binding protein